MKGNSCYLCKYYAAARHKLGYFGGFLAKNLRIFTKRATFAKPTDDNYVIMKNISKYDALKIKAVFLYILNKKGRMNMLPSLKIVFFANKEHLRLYGQPIIEDDFIAMKQGPVPSFLYDAIKFELGREHLNRQYIDVLRGSFVAKSNGYDLYPCEGANLDELSESDKKCLDAAIETYGNLKGVDMSRISHEGRAWEEANNTSSKVMNLLTIASDAGASDEMLKLINDHQEFARFCNS